MMSSEYSFRIFLSVLESACLGLELAYNEDHVWWAACSVAVGVFALNAWFITNIKNKVDADVLTVQQIITGGCVPGIVCAVVDDSSSWYYLKTFYAHPMLDPRNAVPLVPGLLLLAVAIFSIVGGSGFCCYRYGGRGGEAIFARSAAIAGVVVRAVEQWRSRSRPSGVVMWLMRSFAVHARDDFYCTCESSTQQHRRCGVGQLCGSQLAFAVTYDFVYCFRMKTYHGGGGAVTVGVVSSTVMVCFVFVVVVLEGFFAPDGDRGANVPVKKSIVCAACAVVYCSNGYKVDGIMDALFGFTVAYAFS